MKILDLYLSWDKFEMSSNPSIRRVQIRVLNVFESKFEKKTDGWGIEENRN